MMRWVKQKLDSPDCNRANRVQTLINSLCMIGRARGSNITKKKKHCRLVQIAGTKRWARVAEVGDWRVRSIDEQALTRGAFCCSAMAMKRFKEGWGLIQKSPYNPDHLKKPEKSRDVINTAATITANGSGGGRSSAPPAVPWPALVRSYIFIIYINYNH